MVKTTKILAVFVLFSPVICTAQIQSNGNVFIGLSSSILYNLLEISTNSTDLDAKCSYDMKVLLENLHDKQSWTLKGIITIVFRHQYCKLQISKTYYTLPAIDSSARIQPEFLFGNNFWLGSPVECATLETPFHITLNNRFKRIMKSDLLNATAPFGTGYRIVYAKHNTPWQVEVEFRMTTVRHRYDRNREIL